MEFKYEFFYYFVNRESGQRKCSHTTSQLVRLQAGRFKNPGFNNCKYMLMIACSGMALVLALGRRTRVIIAA